MIEVMSKPDAVDNELLASLKAGGTSEPPVKPKTKNPTPKPLAATKSKKPAEDRIIPATVSLRASEHELADGVLAELRKLGIRGNFTDAVKIALRLCPIDNGNALQEAYEKGRAGDKRRRK